MFRAYVAPNFFQLSVHFRVLLENELKTFHMSPTCITEMISGINTIINTIICTGDDCEDIINIIIWTIAFEINLNGLQKFSHSYPKESNCEHQFMNLTIKVRQAIDCFIDK